MTMKMTIATAPALIAALLLAACGGAPGDSAVGTVPPAADAPEEIVPPIVSPQEVADPAEPPSYEVAVATAAAGHNEAMRRCALQPAAVRARCEQEANAAFSTAREDLEDLRGNQP